MTTDNHIRRIEPHSSDTAFRAEFGAALADLVGKIRFRGRDEREWIAQQIAASLAQDREISRRVADRLSAYDEDDADVA